ncbi:hypothetical protein Bca52824_076733 [Brassica carinata]|uniref:Uncharacterized protein n=1 Tax=Brassica carinata TaxID=52824 RepID=A0A8X7PXN7_BRACI|nr:hypothetical protein Bca52824_076733 [Brassica carinata]
MVVFYRVAMEMEFAEKEKTRQMDEQAQPWPWLICLDEDSDMEDASKGVGMDSTMGELNYSILQWGQGTRIKERVSFRIVGQTKAPAVLWDVGIDVRLSSKFCNRERAAAMEASRNVFWVGVLREETKSTDETESTEDLPECDGGGAVGLGLKKVELFDLHSGWSKGNISPHGSGWCGRNCVGVGSVSVDPLEDKGIRGFLHRSMLTLACGEGEEKVGTKSTKTTRDQLMQATKRVGLETLKGFQAAYGLILISQKFCFKCKVRSNNDDPKVLRKGVHGVYAVRLKDCDVFEIRTYE